MTRLGLSGLCKQYVTRIQHKTLFYFSLHIPTAAALVRSPFALWCRHRTFGLGTAGAFGAHLALECPHCLSVSYEKLSMQLERLGFSFVVSIIPSRPQSSRSEALQIVPMYTNTSHWLSSLYTRFCTLHTTKSSNGFPFVL